MRFTYFVVLAGMRTGSNFLEESLRGLPGLRMWGEAFNPHFTGGQGKDSLAGMSLAERDADPLALLARMRARSKGLAGFRLFHDHDPRVRDHVLADPECGKIVLTRSPLESYVSLGIARATGQWRLGDMSQARPGRMRFDAGEFAAFLAEQQGYRDLIRRQLQVSGQTAFQVDYTQLGDVAVLNGIAGFLGLAGRLERPSDRTKVQNPAPLSDKVENPDEMRAALAELDPFAPDIAPSFEPVRGPAVPGYVAAEAAPLLYMPLGPAQPRVAAWMQGLGAEGLPRRDLSQRHVKQWKRRHPGHRSFTVVDHPVRRLHDAFCRLILPGDVASHAPLRAVLRDRYGLEVPEQGPGPGWDAASHRAAFAQFAGFVRGNLGGQTALPVDPAWASQSALLRGLAEFAAPDAVLRAGALGAGLARLGAEIGQALPEPPADAEPGPHPLGAIHDAEIEKLVRDSYQRDYMQFGFRPWHKEPAG